MSLQAVYSDAGKRISNDGRIAIRNACQRVIDTVSFGSLRDDRDRARDFAFGYVRGMYEMLCEYDPDIAGEFGGILLTQTAANGVDHIRATFNRVR